MVVGALRVPEPLGPRYRHAWQALARSLYDGSIELSRDRLLGLASQTGAGLEVEAWPGLLAFRFAVPKGQMDVAGMVAEALMDRAALTASAVEGALMEPGAERGPVATALGFGVEPRANATLADVRELYELARQPGRTFVCVGGDFEPGEAPREFALRDAEAERRARLRRDDGDALLRAEVGGVELARVPLGAWRQGDALGLAAVVALGTGKGSAAHRAARLAGPRCYWVQAALRPTGAGWESAIVGARLPDGTRSLSVAVRQALLQDVEAWDEADRARAVAVAQECWAGTFPQSPLIGFAGSPLGTSLGDRCLLRLLAEAYGEGGAPDWQSVTLEALKSEARRRLGA